MNTSSCLRPCLALSAVLLCLGHAPAATPTPAAGAVVEEHFDTRLKTPKDMHFYLRWPKAAGEIKGVLCYCTYKDSPADLAKQFRDEWKDGDNPAKEALEFADEQGLLLMTWTLGAGFWDKTLSADEMPHQRTQFYDRTFDAVGAVWEQSLRHLIRKYSLPSSNYLICGYSRGAQWAHRIALRQPEYFKAVSIIVNSSYDLPTKGGSKLWWHVATGELENGYEAGKRFYNSCTAQGYQMIFRGDPNMGHKSSGETNKMRWEFFRFALRNMDKPTWQPAYVGDLVNHIVYPIAQSENIPTAQRVLLPNVEIAKLYGEMGK